MQDCACVYISGGMWGLNGHPALQYVSLMASGADVGVLANVEYLDLYTGMFLEWLWVVVGQF